MPTHKASAGFPLFSNLELKGRIYFNIFYNEKFSLYAEEEP